MASRKIPETTKPELPAPTFNLADVERIVNEALAKQAEALAAKQPANGKSDVSMKNELQTIRVFKKAGFKDIQPRLNVLTFRKWLEKGRRPVEGSKALKVANLRLWHVSQTREITAAEKAASKEQSEAAIARHAAKSNVTNIHHPQ